MDEGSDLTALSSCARHVQDAESAVLLIVEQGIDGPYD